MDSQRGKIGQLEKKQKKFDSVLVCVQCCYVYIVCYGLVIDLLCLCSKLLMEGVTMGLLLLP